MCSGHRRAFGDVSVARGAWAGRPSPVPDMWERGWPELSRSTRCSELNPAKVTAHSHSAPLTGQGGAGWRSPSHPGDTPFANRCQYGRQCRRRLWESWSLAPLGHARALTRCSLCHSSLVQTHGRGLGNDGGRCGWKVQGTVCHIRFVMGLKAHAEGRGSSHGSNM